ncbi:hypothetical protein CA13_57910 [Planctomycetes bacterium CA13]|uniref:Uncharacterized protein n=1 Tax=Novipirellula herctigrandis TaxID=2527986 RepID=A0A5C5ZAE7_9BACT|nr:hypothetical protein CA13_57910 [Planctomycetes bacterium CA13]
MRFFVIAALSLVATIGICQTEESKKTPSSKVVESTAVPNPFDIPPGSSDMMGMGGMYGGEISDRMGGGMDGGMDLGSMDSGSMGGYDMGGYGMEAPPPNLEQQFRQGLQRAITMLRQAKSDQQKEKLREYIRGAFEAKYDRMMAQRQKDLDELRKGIEKLESELKRRGEAKDRVVQLQLQSVQLAAEGLLDPGDLQGSGGNATVEGGGYGGGGYGGGGMGGGMM